ncbi:FHA domain-containing protein [Paludisphaera sp.]|uniref:FHA domain-containing protein n=1 Tax=Paludisphaera sp. TaxID=2017432 RepID=UPI00301C66BF
MPVTATNTRWSLEIARGREPGRRYPLDRGETTIGNAPWTKAHLSLGDQEGDTPRRMAARQAVVANAGERLAIRDLDSPGGTFVNRQRLFTNQERVLAPGDVIQVGAVQLVVRAEAAEPPAEKRPAAPPKSAAPPPKPSPPPPPVARTGPLAAPYSFADGATCRTWDDFLTLSAQRWAMVRDDLAAGRIGEHLRRQGRSDLLPRREPGWSPDDVLDDWLGRLPTTMPSGPELDVLAAELTVSAGAAGGVTRRPFRVANVGHRLLRPVIAIEPAPGFAGAIRVAREPVGPIIDEAEYVVEIEPPEGSAGVDLGAVVVSAGGVTRRVPVRVERPRVETIPNGPTDAPPGWSPAEPIGAGLSGVSGWRRLWLFPLVVLAIRGLVGLGASLPYVTPGGALKLAGAATLPTLAGLVVGWGAGMRGGFRDAFASAFAGAVVALLASALVFATIQSVEGVFGSPAVSALALGFGLAVASLVVFPARGGEG